MTGHLRVVAEQSPRRVKLIRDVMDLSDEQCAVLLQALEMVEAGAEPEIVLRWIETQGRRIHD